MAVLKRQRISASAFDSQKHKEAGGEASDSSVADDDGRKSEFDASSDPGHKRKYKQWLEAQWLDEELRAQYLKTLPPKKRLLSFRFDAESPGERLKQPHPTSHSSSKPPDALLDSSSNTWHDVPRNKSITSKLLEAKHSPSAKLKHFPSHSSSRPSNQSIKHSCASEANHLSDASYNSLDPKPFLSDSSADSSSKKQKHLPSILLKHKHQSPRHSPPKQLPSASPQQKHARMLRPSSSVSRSVTPLM